MRFENIQTYNFQHALYGMRNPKNSWHLSDSVFGMCEWDWVDDIAAEVYDKTNEEEFNKQVENGIIRTDDNVVEFAFIGPKDMGLAKILISSGPEHRKFLRQIFVSVDITAPLYWY